LKKYLPTHHEPTSPSKSEGGENESDDKKLKKGEKSN
jgi:hypothetical protein